MLRDLKIKESQSETTFGLGFVADKCPFQLDVRPVFNGAIQDKPERKTPITKLLQQGELSARTRNRFGYGDIDFIGDLTERTPTDLLKIQGFGIKSLMEVSAFLNRLGYKFISK